MCGRCRRTPGAPSPLLMLVSLLLLLLLLAAAPPRAHGAEIVVKRAVGGRSPSASGESENLKICHNSTPCGWEVYARFNRKMHYFVQNTCECSKEKNCSKAEDDVSVSAFVYRCSVEAQQQQSSPSSSSVVVVADGEELPGST